MSGTNISPLFLPWWKVEGLSIPSPTSAGDACPALHHSSEGYAVLTDLSSVYGSETAEGTAPRKWDFFFPAFVRIFRFFFIHLSAVPAGAVMNAGEV